MDGRWLSSRHFAHVELDILAKDRASERLGEREVVRKQAAKSPKS